MWRLLYDLGLRFFYLGATFKAIYNEKARKWIRGRKDIFEYLKQIVDPGKSLIWMHVASLGEYEQGRPVLDALRSAYPDHQFLVTFFSPSGYEPIARKPQPFSIAYLPLDTKSHAEEFMRITRPRMAVFVKYDIWYHYLSKMKDSGVPFYFISSKFRPGQWLFRTHGQFMLDALRSAACVFVQDRQSKELLIQHGFTEVQIVGDTRIDTVMKNAQSSYTFPLKGHEYALVAGSTWPGDEEILFKWLKQSGAKAILAPHEVHEDRIHGLEEAFDGETMRLSQAEEAQHEARIVLVDGIGQLKYLYRFGRVAYVGGGFHKGIHNILEAAVYGIPVIFGPHYRKFREANDLIASGAAFPVRDAEELAKMMEMLSSSEIRVKIRQRLQSYFEEHAGATKKIITRIQEENG